MLLRSSAWLIKSSRFVCFCWGPVGVPKSRLVFQINEVSYWKPWAKNLKGKKENAMASRVYSVCTGALEWWWHGPLFWLSHFFLYFCFLVSSHLCFCLCRCGLSCVIILGKGFFPGDFIWSHINSLICFIGLALYHGDAHYLERRSRKPNTKEHFSLIVEKCAKAVP